MISEKFIEYCQAATKADEENNHENCRVLEPFLQAIISLAKSTENEEELKDCLIAVLRKEIEAPYELMPYCMRALRYVEVIEESNKIYGASEDPRMNRYHYEILEAVESKEWTDSDLWIHMK